MNKNITRLVVVGSLVFFSGCGLLNKKAATTETPTDTMMAASAQPTTEETQKMMAAFKTGASLNCTVSGPTGDKVTFLTKDKKMKSSATNPEKPASISYMINDGQYMYIWTSDETTGFKTAIPTEAEIAATKEKVNALQNQMPDFSDETVQKEYVDKGYAMNCSPGAVSDSEFVPPTTVQFQDMSAMMQKAMEGVPKMPAYVEE